MPLRASKGTLPNGSGGEDEVTALVAGPVNSLGCASRYCTP